MLFTSLEYMFFFIPLAVHVYFFLNKKRFTIVAKYWLSSCSLFFYAWWDYRYVILLLGSILFNYAIGTFLTSGRLQQRRRFMLLSFAITTNLLLLFYFKYVDFFISNINKLITGQLPLLETVLPLGISFFTFTQIAFLVDAYRGEVKEKSFPNYLLFVTFFPHLLAGPILHHKEMMPQFADVKKKIINWKNIQYGLIIFIIGLVKKIVLADTFAVWANFGFDQEKTLTLVDSWITSISYSLQLYFDFSGYTDMAIGAAIMLNIRFPVNFKSPYKAVSIQDFWRRWHITLSTFLRKYVYIPLGGNRKGEYRTYLNLFLTFLIGGIWHGAGWTFIIWGGLHGIALVIHRYWSKLGYTMPKLLAWFITINFVNITWVFFRARSFDDSIKVLKAMFGLNGIKLPEHPILMSPIFKDMGFQYEALKIFAIKNNIGYWLLLGLFIAFILPNSQQILSKLNPRKTKRWAKPFFKRVLLHVLVSYLILIGFCYSFYAYGIDRAVYKAIPFKTEQWGVEITKGDYRSNLYVNSIFKGDERKVIIVGSSFTQFMWSYSFTHKGVAYRSGTVGMGGNSLVNGIRSAASVLNTETNLDTLIIGVAPLNMGPLTPTAPYEKQAIGSINQAGFSFPVNKLEETLNTDMGLRNFLKLTVNLKDPSFYQLHGFFNNLKTRAFRESSEKPDVLSLTNPDREKFYADLKTALEKPNGPPPNVDNGKNVNFKWTERGAIESISPNGDVYKAFTNLKKIATEKQVRLVIYSTPTPTHDAFKEGYPENFLESYRLQMNNLSRELGIEYFDLTEFVPFNNAFMVDFIHGSNLTLRSVHKHLIYSLFSN